ncbi:Multidrug resistance protein MdtK [Fervidicola ferrireducens]|uniref:Probable multidrug resistance protein NorM n=2 Tax=Fervidicola ferrireducens TaxID=520764 RepID=A0A140L1R3_9FIRM|nr:Multidrug resistance protein MdtK [Fervidicola ferrireducens]
MNGYLLKTVKKPRFILLRDKDIKEMLNKAWTLAWPVVIEQALATLSQVADMAMVGRLGAEAVAAVGLSMHPFFLLNALIMGISVGTTALAARAVGSGDREKAGRVTGQSVIAALLIGFILVILAFVNSFKIMIYMGAEPSVRPLGSNYLRAMMPGMLFLFIFSVAAAGIRGAGDTRTPMTVNAVINIFHIFTNYLFIFGGLGFPRLEVVGAGISSSISRLAGAIWLIYFLSKPNKVLFVNWEKVAGNFDWLLFSKMMKIGIPAALERILISTGQIVYTRLVANLGTEAYAAHSLSLNVESFSYMPGIGFATAATAMVGQYLGAGDIKGAQRSAAISLLMAMAIMGTMGLLFFSFPAAFLKIFTSDSDVIKMGTTLLRIVAFTQIPECIGMVIPGALRGAGDTKVAVYITILGMWIVRIGFTWYFLKALNMGLVGAWIAMFLDWAVRSALYIIRFKGGQWKNIKV